MKTRENFLIVVGLLVCSYAFAQEPNSYEIHTKQAYEHVEAAEYDKAARQFKLAFDFFEGKAYPEDRYEAARAYSMAGNADTAFYHLFRLADDSKFQEYEKLKKDEFLDPLHKDTRWKRLTKQVKSNKKEAEKYLDKRLVKELAEIYREDQTYRQQLDSLEKVHGYDSPELQKLWSVIHVKDSANLVAVTNILDERGWLGPKVVGEQGNSVLFLVIQHADIETQQKYLPMMREAVKKGDAQGNQLALLEDRVALRTGKKQVYGSQIGRDPETGEYFVLPLEDPEQVDRRREEVGLSPLSEYTKHFGFEWSVERHKKKLEDQE